MRSRQNTLLTGIAALALLVGAGLASAQDTTKSQGAAGGTAGPSASRPMSHSEGGGSAMKGQSAQSPSKGQSAQSGAGMGETAKSTKGVGPSSAQQSQGGMTNRNAQENRLGKENQAQETIRGGKTDQDRNRAAQRQEQRGGTAIEGQETTRGNANTAEQQRGGRNAQRDERGLKGLQGNTSKPMQSENGRGEGDLQLSEQQRTTIRSSVIESREAPRIERDRVHFDVRVGTVVPREDIRVAVVPEPLIRIHPRWRGYRYFVLEDEIVIVNPRSMQIVAVLPV